MVMNVRNFALPAFTGAGFRRGVVAALPFVASNGVAGMIMGVAYKGLGLGFLPAVLFSLVVYSATAQAVTLGLWTLPPPVGAMVAACAAVNARYLVMGAHLRQLFAGAPRRRVMLPILFLLADASWLMTSADAERHGGPDAGYLLGSSLPMAVGWIGGTALGYAFPWTPAGPLAAAAALLPLTFVVALLPSQWRGRKSVLPWAVSGVAALAAAGIVGPQWAMLIGGGVGTFVGVLATGAAADA
jgi:predicted branched-subunit amino acid permease